MTNPPSCTRCGNDQGPFDEANGYCRLCLDDLHFGKTGRAEPTQDMRERLMSPMDFLLHRQALRREERGG